MAVTRRQRKNLVQMLPLHPQLKLPGSVPGILAALKRRNHNNFYSNRLCRRAGLGTNEAAAKPGQRQLGNKPPKEGRANGFQHSSHDKSLICVADAKLFGVYGTSIETYGFVYG